MSKFEVPPWSRVREILLEVASSRGDRLNTEVCICIVMWNAVFMQGFVAIGLEVLA